MAKSKKQQELENQVNDLTLDLQRTRADFENYRKRVEQEKTFARDAGQASAILKLLPSIDNIERAIAHAPEDLKEHTWVKSVTGLTKQLDKSLDGLNLKRIAAQPGDEFDPELHEAIQFDEDAEGDKEVIDEVLQSGYLLNGTPIRHAMVKVTRKQCLCYNLLMVPWAKQTGFTIVELLIVIVVIAILAAISIVAYNGIQQRARDNIRIQDLAQLAKATKLYAVDNGDHAELNCGNGTGSGWLTSDYDGTGPFLPINDCLTRNGHLSKVLRDPSGLSSCGGLGCFAYMKYSCSSGTFYFAHLETVPQTSTDLDSTCSGAASWDTTYGMNYILKVN